MRHLLATAFSIFALKRSSSGSFIRFITGIAWKNPGSSVSSNQLLPSAAAGEQDLPRVHVALVGDGCNDTIASTNDAVEFGVGHLGKDIACHILVHDICDENKLQ